ncbi:MAG: Rieske 2Fe-2S domain-containing protein [Flavobacteriaceae bacterium]
MKSRRDFLKEVCPSVAFAFFGLSFLESCSSGDDDVAVANPNNGNSPGTNSGYTKSGNTYTIDLTNSNFNQLSNTGDWMNGKNIGIPALFLRISSTEIQAYTNSCPHQGVNDRWQLVGGDTFKCNQHGNSYSADCNSALTCYNTVLDGDTLTLTI